MQLHARQRETRRMATKLTAARPHRHTRPSLTRFPLLPSLPRPEGGSLLLIVSVVTRAASPSLLLILALCFAPSLAAARTLCVKPARIHLASPPTLTQEHSADHRPVAIASECAIAAMSAQMRFHVRSLSSSRIVGPGVRSRKKPVPVPVPCRRCALHHHALHLPLASRGATSCLPRAQRRPTPAIWRSTLRILRNRLVLRLCQFSEGRGLRLASHTQASQAYPY